jgi:hypothetical protein
VGHGETGNGEKAGRSLEALEPGEKLLQQSQLGAIHSKRGTGKTVFYFGKRNLILALDKRENNDYGIVYWPDGQTSFQRIYSSAPLKTRTSYFHASEN